MSELAFVFHYENCIQCHACELACKSRRQVEYGLKWRDVRCIWRGTYPRTSIETHSVSCIHCIRPSCAEVCHAGAISKRPEDGVVLVDPALCNGCRDCEYVCPVGAPVFGADDVMQKCDLCVFDLDTEGGKPICVLTCPTGALELVWMSNEEKAAQVQSISAI